MGHRPPVCPRIFEDLIHLEKLFLWGIFKTINQQNCQHDENNDQSCPDLCVDEKIIQIELIHDQRFFDFLLILFMVKTVNAKAIAEMIRDIRLFVIIDKFLFEIKR